MKAEAAEWRGKLIEEVASTDDALMEKFFEDPDSITADELLAAIRKATISMQIVPMLCGSSFHNKGVQKLLDYVMAFLPSPLDLPPVTGMNPKTEQEEVRHASESDPFCGLAFKIATDPFVGRLAFVRVYSGKLEAGSYVHNSRSGKKERISRLYQMHANKQNPMEIVGAGDICAAVGFKDIRTGDTLCDPSAPVKFAPIDFPASAISLAVSAKKQGDEDKVSVILNIGLEATNEFAGQGITTDNAAKFWAYGEGIESIKHGVFKTKDIQGLDMTAFLKEEGKDFTKEQLDAINGGHYSVMLTGLNGDTEYTFAGLAYNGYASKLFTASIKTTGVYNPGLESEFLYSDFLPQKEQPSKEYLISTEWNYYAVNVMDEKPMRRKIGTVTIEDDPAESSSADLLTITGLPGVEFDEGGRIPAVYVPSTAPLAGITGAISPLLSQTPIGVINGEDILAGCVSMRSIIRSSEAPWPTVTSISCPPRTMSSRGPRSVICIR